MKVSDLRLGPSALERMVVSGLREAALARVQVLRGREGGQDCSHGNHLCGLGVGSVGGQTEVRAWAAGILDVKAMFFKLRPRQAEGGLLSFIFGWSQSKKKENLEKKKKKGSFLGRAQRETHALQPVATDKLQ